MCEDWQTSATVSHLDGSSGLEDDASGDREDELTAVVELSLQLVLTDGLVLKKIECEDTVKFVNSRRSIDRYLAAVRVLERDELAVVVNVRDGNVALGTALERRLCLHLQAHID